MLLITLFAYVRFPGQVARGKVKKGRCESIALSDSGRLTFTGWDGDTGLVMADTFDPDKNQIELQVDNVPEEKFAEYFDNGEFTENPIGIKFDPDEMTARLAAGEPEEALLKRPDGTPPDLSEFPVN